MVSLKVPAVELLSLTVGAVSAWPEATPEKALKPLFVNALLPWIVKLPASVSAGAAAALSTPRAIVAGAEIVPKLRV